MSSTVKPTPTRLIVEGRRLFADANATYVDEYGCTRRGGPKFSRWLRENADALLVLAEQHGVLESALRDAVAVLDGAGDALATRYMPLADDVRAAAARARAALLKAEGRG